MNEKKLPGGIRALLAFLSVILCLALFVSTLAVILVTDIRVVTSKGGLSTIITQALFPGRTASSPVRSPLAAGYRSAFALSNGAFQGELPAELVDSLYDMLKESFGEELPVSREQVEAFLSSSTVPEFLTDKVAGIVSDMFTGESTTSITKDEVMGLIEDNKELIENTLNVTIKEEDIQQVGQWLEESHVMEELQGQISQIPGLALPDNTQGDADNEDEQAAQQIREVLTLVRELTSVTALLGCIAVCLLLIGLLFLTHWGRPFAAIRTAGIPVLLAGLFMVLPTVLVNAIPGLFEGDTAQIAGVIVKAVLSMTGTVSLCFAVLGLAMIVAGIVLGRVMKKKCGAVPVMASTAPAEVHEVPAEEAPAGDAPENE